ncbi:MAG: hypothetical protein ABSE44_00620 [Candidatus Sulfotelmatobacter sp.]|jgi:hypothetical protein
MTKAGSRAHKYLCLDVAKLRRAQKAFGAKTETETIELALDLVIAEDRKNRLLWRATERFLRSGIVINDVYGNLD